MVCASLAGLVCHFGRRRLFAAPDQRKILSGSGMCSLEDDLAIFGGAEGLGSLGWLGGVGDGDKGDRRVW